MPTEAKRSRWSWQLGRLFGISIRVHITLIALLVWIAIAAPMSGAGAAQALSQFVLVNLIFVSIVIHELAHALVARRFGCPTREILLLPIGGIAKLDRMPARPGQELLVALAGPASNVVIALVLGGVIGLVGWPVHLEQPSLLASFVVQLFVSNLALGAFNLLPAFPMDGGRVLRAALAWRFGRLRATRAATSVAKVLATIFVIAGLSYGATMLAFIGVFVWLAAAQESASVALTAALSDVTVADAMMRTSHVVDSEDPIDEVAQQMIVDGHRELAVAEGGRVTGVVTLADLAPRMATAAPHGVVGLAMHRDVPVVEPMTRLVEVLETLDRAGVLLVGDRDTVIGMLTLEQLATFAALHRVSL